MYREIENQLPVIEDFVDKDDLRLNYAGLTEEQIAELANDPLFTFQAHTQDHPFLTLCSKDEVLRQFGNNKAWLERVTGQECSAVAYPSGDYDAVTVNVCRNAGFKHGFAVISKRVGVPAYEISRVGVYSKSVRVLHVKARFGHTIRAFRLAVG